MPKYTDILITENIDDLKKLKRSLKSHRSRTRIQSLILTKEKRFKKRSELAIHLSVSLSSLNRWTKEYLENGIDAVVKINSGGHKPSSVTKEIHDALSEKVYSSENPFQSYVEAVQWVNKTFDKEYHYNLIREYLIKHFKTKLKSPRKSHYKKDERAIEAFKKTSKTV